MKDYTDTAKLTEFMTWVRGSVLPYWLASGVDGVTGAGLEGVAYSSQTRFAVRPLVTQAKLIYVLSRSECLGWGAGYQGVINRLFAFVSKAGTSTCRSDGYIHSWDEDYKTLDARYDLADHAYFMLASVGAYTAFGTGGDIRRAMNIFEWLKLHFKCEHSGWRESFTEEDFSNQIENETAKKQTDPILSLSALSGLLEVFLYLHEVTQKQQWAELATECYQLVSKFGWDQNSNRLFARITPLQGVSQVKKSQCIVEASASEYAQWVWLLCRYHKATGAADTSLIQNLYQSSKRLFTKQVKCSSRGAVESSVIYYARQVKAALYMSAQKIDGGQADLDGAMTYIRSCATTKDQGLFFDKNSNAKLCTANEMFEVFQAALQAQLFVSGRLSAKKSSD